jgi:hypothetical protein
MPSSSPRETPRESCLPLADLITDATSNELITCGATGDDPATAQLLQAVAQELQEPEHVLMPYKHCYAAQGATTLPPRQLSVYPPDLEGVPEADLDRLPLDGRSSSFHIPQILPVSNPSGNSSGLAM